MNRALICDFDNTLYDWVGFFVPSLFVMIDEAVRILGCDRESLIAQLRHVHRLHGDSEHPFALLETEIVRTTFSEDEAKEVLDPAFHAFNRARKDLLKLYPGVAGTLALLKEARIPIIGHTEARPLAVIDRLQRLGLQNFFDRVYCRVRADAHADLVLNNAQLPVVELSHHQQKPDPLVLAEICAREGFYPGNTVYVGDSLFKDVSMANSAGVFAAWAEYGTRVSPADYEKLVSVSHWSDEDVERARAFAKGSVPAKPDLTLEHDFSEVLPLFSRAPIKVAL